MFLRYDHCKLHARSQDLYPEVTMHMLGSACVTFIMHTADTCFDSFHVLYSMYGAVRKSLFFF